MYVCYNIACASFCCVSARYSDDLHELLVKLVLLSEVATLSVAKKLHSPSGDINVSIDIASQNTCENRPGKCVDDWNPSRRDIVNFLEEWDEPFQSNKTENVSGECSNRSLVIFVFSAYILLEWSFFERHSRISTNG
jgi:hypothetical protein